MASLFYLPSNEWIDIHSAMSLPLTGSVILRNYGSNTTYISVGELTPVNEGFPVLQGEWKSIENKFQKVWVRGAKDTPIWVGDQDGSEFKDYMLVDLPNELYTSTGGVANSKRIRVESGQHSFWEGKEYRTFKELNVPVSGIYTVRINVTQDVILKSLRVSINSGKLRLTTFAGGVEDGVFSETFPILRKNTMSTAPNRPSTTIITAGGSVAPVSLIDVETVYVGEMQGNRISSTVGVSEFDERGVGAGLYYWGFQNLSTTETLTGTFHVYWEER